MHHANGDRKYLNDARSKFPVIPNVFFTNGILSHNTTCAAAYLLWRALFRENQTILVTANKLEQTKEILERVKYAYERLPPWLVPGLTENNKTTVKFDNGSSIVCRATSEDSGRGLSVSLLYCVSGDGEVEISDKWTGTVRKVRMEDLFKELSNEI